MMIKELIKLFVFLIFISSIGLAGLGLVQEDVKPTLQVGSLFQLAAVAAALLLGPGIAFLEATFGRNVLRQDFEEVRSRPAPGSYRLIADLLLKYPALYYVFLSAVCTGAFGGGAWGVLTYFERGHAQDAGNVNCVVLSTRKVVQSGATEMKLKCPSGHKQKVLELRINSAPVNVPDEVFLPVSHGVLGTVFIDGSKVRL